MDLVVDEVHVVVAHQERATLRVGDVFLKVDGDQARIDLEVEAMERAPSGAALRRLHDAPRPPWPGRDVEELARRLEVECEWLVTNDVLPADVVTRNRRLAEAALRPWTPVFIHGDLQIVHVFVDGDEVTGSLDWSEAAPGDALFDLATLTLAHEERLDDVVAGYGGDVDRDLIRSWWSLRSLLAIRWLAGAGYGSPETFPEVAALRSAT